MSQPVSLDDKYARDGGRAFISGTQALVRLPLMQLERDRAAGLDTACYITGYRGSPLAGLDRQLAAAKKFFDGKPIVFQPGLNEDLAATAVWGTQQVGLNGPAKHAGVFTMWYAKGPGVDRSGDALRHGNLAGSAPLGGVLLLAGDDHTCNPRPPVIKSGSRSRTDDPVLNPRTCGDHRLRTVWLGAVAYSGCWVALKCVKDNVEATASVAIDPGASPSFRPIMSFRRRSHPLAGRRRNRRSGARAQARRHRLLSGQRTRLRGDRRCGRAAGDRDHRNPTDVRRARSPGVGRRSRRRRGHPPVQGRHVLAARAARGVRVADGLGLVIVVEEKRSLIEAQLQELLYGRPGAPCIVGKMTSRVRAFSIRRRARSEPDCGRDRAPAGRPAATATTSVAGPDLLQRGVHFCAGCPHNTSTRLPEDSRGYCGIGCSGMVQFMERGTAGPARWAGRAELGRRSFAKDTHVFQALGDGTYYHSGLLAIRASVASRASITFRSSSTTPSP